MSLFTALRGSPWRDGKARGASCTLARKVTAAARTAPPWVWRALCFQLAWAQAWETRSSWCGTWRAGMTRQRGSIECWSPRSRSASSLRGGEVASLQST
jgi:hypothetical protein